MNSPQEDKATNQTIAIIVAIVLALVTFVSAVAWLLWRIL